MDLLAILSHKRSWIDEMFHHNRAKQLAEKNSVPLIVFQLESLSITGYGQSEMEDIAKPYVEKQGRYILPDQEPEKGYFFRSDHFNFAKIGIPALYAVKASMFRFATVVEG